MSTAGKLDAGTASVGDATVADSAASGPNGLARMPPEVRQLEHRWESLVGKVPGLTRELERDFRFGQSVDPSAGGYRLGGSIKGGSSSIWSPVSEREHNAYLGWAEHDGVPAEEDREVFDALLELLRRHNIEFHNSGYRSMECPPNEYVASRGYLYRAVFGVLSELPPSHLARPEFRRLTLGGGGPDCAKGSAYDKGAVLMYDFAIKGARRTFLGLFLHELGHVIEGTLNPSQRLDIVAAHGIIVEADALIGLDFLQDSESRKSYQQFAPNEFVAETHIVYTSQGTALRRFIEHQKEDVVRDAWQQTYRVFREAFDGMEYE